MELLLAAKAPIDQANKYGHTALIVASLYGNSDVAGLLEFWSQLTPLMLAVVLQSPQEIKALLHDHVQRRRPNMRRPNMHRAAA